MQHLATNQIVFKPKKYQILNIIILHEQKNQEDTRLDQSMLIMFPVMSFLAGLLGGIFGIGGGMLISPLLLQAGIPPQVCNKKI